jgi:hypothetical protein
LEYQAECGNGLPARLQVLERHVPAVLIQQVFEGDTPGRQVPLHPTQARRR